MLRMPPREDLAALTKAAQAIVPLVTFGYSRRLDAARVSVAYSYPHGIGEFVLPVSDVPAAFLPSTEALLETDTAAARANPQTAIDYFLGNGNVERVVSAPIGDDATPARFWMGTSAPDPLTIEQKRKLEEVARAGLGVLEAGLRSANSPDELRRLELAAALLPGLLHVLDVREVFDQGPRGPPPEPRLGVRHLQSSKLNERRCVGQDSRLSFERPRMSSAIYALFMQIREASSIKRPEAAVDYSLHLPSSDSRVLAARGRPSVAPDRTADVCIPPGAGS